MFLLAMPASAQPWSGILPSGTGIDWTKAGVPGGIPTTRTQCGSTITATGSDQSGQINTALSGCGSGHFVLLATGTFLINSHLTIPSNVTLRGAGAQQTILDAHGGDQGVIIMGLPDGTTPTVANTTNVNSGNTSGSASIVVASATGISVGGYLLITELNDSTYVTITTPNGTCTWCDNSMWSATRVRGQIVEVASVSGTTIGIDPPLYSDYGIASGTSPAQATRFTATTKNAGVENLQIFANNTGYTSSIFMNACAYCWVKGVEDNYADADHVEIYFSYRPEVRDSYFSNAYLHTSGSSDSCVFIVGKTSGALIENNIFERLHSSVMLNWGAAGNVIAYNYSFGSFDSSATTVMGLDFQTHGAHPQFNLFEGNVIPEYAPDAFWGSSSNNTIFRSLARGTTTIAPYGGGGYTGRGVINWAGAHFANQNLRPYNIAFPHTNWSIVGSLAGSTDLATVTSNSLYNGGPSECTACVIPTAGRAYQGTGYEYSFGYNTSVDTDGSPVSGFVSGFWVGKAWNSAFLHGDYDQKSATVIWDVHATGSHTLPASFYLAAKPPWFGSVAWPAIGPDVTGGDLDSSATGGHANTIPALLCYNNTARDANGIKQFDADTCYAPTPLSPLPSAPMGAPVFIRH